MDAEREVLLEVQGLCYAYGERVAVRDTSFQIHAQEVFGLLGPNGAGKTTTIRCLSGLLSGWQGEIRFRSDPFRPAERIEDRRMLGVVPQELALYTTNPSGLVAGTRFQAASSVRWRGLAFRAALSATRMARPLSVTR